MTPKQKAKEFKAQFGSNAKYVCLEIIEILKMLRKPEYTTFIIRYANGIDDVGESMDGYELTDFYQQVKQILETK